MLYVQPSALLSDKRSGWSRTSRIQVIFGKAAIIQAPILSVSGAVVVNGQKLGDHQRRHQRNHPEPSVSLTPASEAVKVTCVGAAPAPTSGSQLL